ncbi:very-long-chain 3-oxoacyl-CoA reductase-B-like isoform X2 [Eublepharis macularius]|nr:very-long-chain 3-oxoacyl-CoA reductase-B-like isoform X2 [Eublepharis macularius]XP_054855299.1 very-long-chain 3-oxoacyl-CoA reductase-B-like isoform X2 [Eublepharis macularius]XP_054855301.1 very-long-chain 3-oxoacyl-CoA reductase-B-like isoform X2 [Eublepharis macularius]XP_054855302.1 very-long-chain 3-oxoacyl-CoA reductase-B-like isoform X2 [Eublepharis macularius]
MAVLNIFSLEQMLHVVGVLSVLWLSLKTVWALAHGVRIFLLSEKWRGVDLASYGPWAVVTGATAGIGKAYSHELARRGLNVVLISRSLEKLKQVAAEIEEQHGRSTRVIQADFTGGSEIYELIGAALQGLEIGILVNNVGQSVQTPMYFLDGVYKGDQYIYDLVHCNMLSYVKMTQIVLPQMVARKKGIVIYMSSAAALRPLPLALLYSASKVFDDFFAQGLDAEYRSKGIIVQSITPHFVESNMTRQINRHYKLSAASFARQALNTVGLSRRTTGSLSHSIQCNVLFKRIPEWIFVSPFAIPFILYLWKKCVKERK